MSPEDIEGRTFAEAIEAGPVTIQDYMRFANNAYYNRNDPLGAEGDFITAPEISQIFGEMIGIWLTDIWLRNDKPQRCHYVELGPGRGTLAADALRTMRRLAWLLFAVSLILSAVLLSGCATKSTLPCEPPTPVTMPVPSQPEPAVSYLLSAQTDILTWQAKLRAMFQTTAPL